MKAISRRTFIGKLLSASAVAAIAPTSFVKNLLKSDPVIGVDPAIPGTDKTVIQTHDLRILACDNLSKWWQEKFDELLYEQLTKES